MQNTRSRAELAESLKKLAEAGCLVDPSVADTKAQDDDVEINQVGESLVFDLPYGGTGYIFDLEIINQTSKPIYCSELPEPRLQWEDPFFDWLPDPKERPRRVSYFRRGRNGHRELVHAVSDSYCFFGGTQLEYPREEVLNHILLKRRILSPGRPLRGLLLARGVTMPVELQHGKRIETTFSLISSKHVEYTASVLLGIDRMQAKAKPARKSSIYDEPVGNVGSNGATRVQPAVARDFGIESATSGSGHSAVPEESRIGRGEAEWGS
jgi:hypothetical protein